LLVCGIIVKISEKVTQICAKVLNDLSNRVKCSN